MLIRNVPIDYFTCTINFIITVKMVFLYICRT